MKIRILLGKSPGILLLPKDSFLRNMGMVGEKKRKKLLIIELQHGISNNVVCAPGTSKASGQPAHMPLLVA